MKIRFTLYGKSGSNYVREDRTPYEIDAVSVPRVGEIVDVGAYFEFVDRQSSTFIVQDVTWIVVNKKLMPDLHCRMWFNGDRRMELEENGWL